MDKVYIVTVGRWSEYTICGVFTTEEMAQQYIDCRHWSDVPEIEKWPLNPHADQLRDGLSFFEVEIGVNTADVYQIKKNSPRDDDIDTIARTGDPRFAKVLNQPHYANDYLFVYCWARDEQHAAKIAMEKRAVWLANRGK